MIDSCASFGVRNFVWKILTKDQSIGEFCKGGCLFKVRQELCRKLSEDYSEELKKAIVNKEECFQMTINEKASLRNQLLLQERHVEAYYFIPLLALAIVLLVLWVWVQEGWELASFCFSNMKRPGQKNSTVRHFDECDPNMDPEYTESVANSQMNLQVDLEKAEIEGDKTNVSLESWKSVLEGDISSPEIKMKRNSGLKSAYVAFSVEPERTTMDEVDLAVDRSAMRNKESADESPYMTAASIDFRYPHVKNLWKACNKLRLV